MNHCIWSTEARLPSLRELCGDVVFDCLRFLLWRCWHHLCSPFVQCIARQFKTPDETRAGECEESVVRKARFYGLVTLAS